MATYNLDQLGNSEFEQMCQSLLKEVIGSGTITFGSGPDGGREATFRGKAPYPSQSTQWEGNWIFQVKFHDTRLVGHDRARQQLLTELGTELDKIANKYRRECDNYILITNVALSPYPERGTLDRIGTEIKTKYTQVRPNIAVWGQDDVCRLLDKYPGIRTAYRHLLTAGDLISKVMQIADETQGFGAISIRNVPRSALMPIASQSDLARLAWGERADHFSTSNGMGAAIPQESTDHDTLIVDRRETDIIIAKLKKSMKDGVRPRVVVIGSPVTGKSAFLWLVAKAWVKEGYHLAFLIGDELSLADRDWLASHPEALVLVDQEADEVIPRRLLKQLHMTARAVVLATRPGYQDVACEVFDSVYLPEYLYTPGVRDAVTCHLSAEDPQFVSEVVRRMACRYEVPLSPEAESALTNLLFGVGPIESRSEAALGVAKAFFVAAREWQGGEARARLSQEEIRQLAVSLLEHARDQKSPSQAVLTALFGKLPHHLRKLTLVLRFLRDAFGKKANTYHAEALTAAWYVYYGTPVDETAVEDALSLGIINVHRFGNTGRPYYALRHLWQLEVLHDKISEARRSELQAAFIKELDNRMPALRDSEDRAAVLYDVAFLYWETATSAGRREAARLYVQSRSVFDSITGRIAIDELCRNMVREAGAPTEMDASIAKLQELLTYLDLDQPAAYEAKANVLSSFRAAEECAPKHISSPTRWRDKVEGLARIHLTQKSGDEYWVSLYRGSSIAKVAALELGEQQRKDSVERLIGYYKGVLDEMCFVKVLAIGVSYAVADADHAIDMFVAIEEAQRSFFTELSPGQQAYYYANVTWLLFQRERDNMVPSGTVARWIGRFSVFLWGLASQDRIRLFAICLATAVNSSARAQDGQNPVRVIDDIQLRLIGTLEDKGRYYGLALAVAADGDMQGEDRGRFNVFLQYVWERLEVPDREFASRVSDHVAERMASRNFTIHCLAKATRSLSNPDFANRALAQRLSSVQSFIGEVVSLMSAEPRDLASFLCLSISSVLGATPRNEAIGVWLPSLSTQARDWLSLDVHEELFWRSSRVARYYGGIIGRLILRSECDPALLDGVLEYVSASQITDDRLLVETLSYALDYIGIQLVIAPSLYPDREKWASYFQSVVASTVRWFDPGKCEANKDLSRVLIVTTVLKMGLEGYRQPEDTQHAAGSLIAAGQAHGLCDDRFGAILARGSDDLGARSQDPSGMSRLNRLSVLESYAALVKTLIAQCHELGDKCNTFMNSSDRAHVVESCNEMRCHMKKIRDELQLFQPRLPEINAFETAVESFLSEWDWEFENLAKAMTTADKELHEEVGRRWTIERSALWAKMMELIPPVPLVPPLRELASVALANCCRTAKQA